jgi:hypothetical protein
MPPAPEQMFWVHARTYAYYFSRYSYSAFGAVAILTDRSICYRACN